MLIIHCCQYETTTGQRLQIVAGGKITELVWTTGHWWKGEVEISGAYRYRLVEGDTIVRQEHGPDHEPPPGLTHGTQVVDRWQEQDALRTSRRSSLFSRARAVHHRAEPCIEPENSDGVRFRLLEPDVPSGWHPVVLVTDGTNGSTITIPMRPAHDGYPWWEAVYGPTPVAGYRYALRRPDGGLEPEPGQLRIVPPDATRTMVVDEAIRGRSGWRGAGLALPVFALRGEHSLGVGQFNDLPAFIDWAADAGMSVVQLLPINDTTVTHDWQDSYPYDPVSVHALHPLYIDVLDLPGADAVVDEVTRLRGELDGLPQIDYLRVMSAKWRLLRTLYAADRNCQGLLAFMDAEWDWLGPYALWCVLRDRHGTADRSEWGLDATFDPTRVAAVRRPDHADHDEFRFHAWLQFHLHRQLEAAAEHAWSRGVALKGDLPIGVSPHSVETWEHPEWFNIGTQTGAPPDDFAVDGQNWGFPTYDWEAMADDGYQWWRHRFAALARTFDAYRIDHVLGFFRIWEIPAGQHSGLRGRFLPCLPLTEPELRGWLDDIDLAPLVTPLDDDPRNQTLLAVPGGWHPRIQWWKTSGYDQLSTKNRSAFDDMANAFFYARHDALWRGRGRMALRGVVEATDMLACGEDLGMVPPQVPEVMRELGMLSLEIERMPKQLGHWRTDPATVPYLSVTSTGTHDMAVLRGWWRESPTTAARLWNEVLKHDGQAPTDLPSAAAEDIVAAQFASPAMLAILPLQDLLAIDAELAHEDPDAECINVPDDRHHRWCYRLHLTTSELHCAGPLTSRLRLLVERAGRATC